MSQRKFRQNVIDGLLDGFEKRRPCKRGRRLSESTKARLVERHFIKHYEDKKMQPNCIVCSIMPSKCSKKGKGVCKRKQTTYYCGQCDGNPPLCVTPCFELYHTNVNYKKVCKCN